MGADRERGKMAEIKQYVEILLESLKKKKSMLQNILEQNIRQEEVIRNNWDMDEFDRTVKLKRRYIWELESLDSGFEKVYARIKEELSEVKEHHRDEISQMQKLISEITDLSVRIQASEERNKKLVETYFSYTRGKIRESKKSVRVASDYYKSMSGTNYTDARLMDRKN